MDATDWNDGYIAATPLTVRTPELRFSDGIAHRVPTWRQYSTTTASRSR